MSGEHGGHPDLCLLAYSPVASDARVLRQARALSRFFNVHLAGFGPRPPSLSDLERLHYFELGTAGTTFASGPKWRRIAALGCRFSDRMADLYCHHVSHMRYGWHFAQSRRFRVIYCNDVDTLPAAIAARRVNRSVKIVLDLHEYPTREFSDGDHWRLERKPFVTGIMKHQAPRAQATITVAPSFVPLMRREFGIRKPVVVLNAPGLVELPPRRPPDGRIRLIHHGACLRQRRLEGMIGMMPWLDERFVLHFMLTDTDPEYRAELERSIPEALRPRVVFEPPVPPDRIVETIARHDLGVFLLPPEIFNYEHALPPKFFDFIGAGLAVAVGPSPNMARLVREHDFGWVSDDFRPESLGRLLTSITPEVLEQKRRHAFEARRLFNADTEMEKLVALVQKVAGD